MHLLSLLDLALCLQHHFQIKKEKNLNLFLYVYVYTHAQTHNYKYMYARTDVRTLLHSCSHMYTPTCAHTVNSHNNITCY